MLLSIGEISTIGEFLDRLAVGDALAKAVLLILFGEKNLREPKVHRRSGIK
jgi:hypothetical protein